MYAKTYGETVCGINGEEITVEVDISNGLPGFDIVGLPDTAVKESRERVKAALKNSGLIFPMTRITVNLAPADLRKDGSSLDLPIAVGILTAAGSLMQEETGGKIFVGELALDGSIRQVTGVLPMILYAKEHGWREIYIPQGNASEGELVDGIDVYTPQNLGELVSHLKGQERLPKLPKTQLNADCVNAYDVDFAEVRGQQVVKRALEIAAAGGHNVLMVGAPGSGKTIDDGGRNSGSYQNLQHRRFAERQKANRAGASVPQPAPYRIRQRADWRRQHTTPRRSNLGAQRCTVF